MKTLLCFCLCLLVTFASVAQVNLVPNPSFEDIKNCHTISGITDSPTDFPYLQHWFSPIPSSPDYFNICSDTTYGYSMPNNKTGYQYARSGSGYAGLILLFQINDYREYVSTRLKTPLAKGGIYKVTWYVSLANKSNNTISQIGCLFSPAIPGDQKSMFEQQPQVQNDNTRFLNDTALWLPISGYFKATGAEEYITIGNFNKDGVTLTYKHNSNLPSQAYYYIDDVSALFFRDGLNTLLDTMICPGSAVQMTMRAGYDSCRWNDGDTSRIRSFTTPGKYWIHQYFDRNIIVTDTLQLSFFDTIPVVTRTAFCSRPTFTLKARTALTYQWSSGDTAATTTVAKDGPYWVKRTHNNCYAIDSFNVTMFPLPQILTLRDTATCFEELGNMVLDGGSFSDYKWEPVAPNTATYIATEATTVKLTVTDTHLCTNSKTILVKDSCSPYLFIPNAFTPNGDGLNDVFLPNTRNLATYELTIINRWGAILFTTQNPLQGWDGKDAQADVYMAQVRYTTAGKKTQLLKQTVTLLR